MHGHLNVKHLWSDNDRVQSRYSEFFLSTSPYNALLLEWSRVYAESKKRQATTAMAGSCFV